MGADRRYVIEQSVFALASLVLLAAYVWLLRVQHGRPMQRRLSDARPRDTKPRVPMLLWGASRLGLLGSLLCLVSAVDPRGVHGWLGPRVALLLMGVAAQMWFGIICLYLYVKVDTAAAMAMGSAPSLQQRLRAGRIIFPALFALSIAGSTTRSVLTLVYDEQRWDALWTLMFAALCFVAGTTFLVLSTFVVRGLSRHIETVGSLQPTESLRAARRRLRQLQVVTALLTGSGNASQLIVGLSGYRDRSDFTLGDAQDYDFAHGSHLWFAVAVLTLGAWVVHQLAVRQRLETGVSGGGGRVTAVSSVSADSATQLAPREFDADAEAFDAGSAVGNRVSDA